MIDYGKLAAFRQTLPEYQRHEEFRFFASVWDVVKARYLAAEAQREPKLTAIEPWVQFFGIHEVDQEHTLSIPIGMAAEEVDMNMSGAIHIDTTWAMSDACNLEQPLIFVTIVNEEGKCTHLLIGGLHRLYKAHRLGQERLPYFMLTVEESNLVRMR